MGEAKRRREQGDRYIATMTLAQARDAATPYLQSIRTLVQSASAERSDEDDMAAVLSGALLGVLIVWGKDLTEDTARALPVGMASAIMAFFSPHGPNFEAALSYLDHVKERIEAMRKYGARLGPSIQDVQ